jgi:hypothetical protein
MAVTTNDDHSSAGTPRSTRNVAAIATTQTPVASPYYVDGRNVVPVVYTFVTA